MFTENRKESQGKAKKYMDVRAQKHAAKLAEWGEKITACRSSGLTVKAWCEQNQVCSKTYYTWERMYLAEVSKPLTTTEGLPKSAGQLVRIDPTQLPDEQENGRPVLPAQDPSRVEITLRYGNMSVEMPAGMEIRQVAELMKAMVRVC